MRGEEKWSYLPIQNTETNSSLLLAEADGSLHHSYNRKQKSLGLLCSKFVELYNRDDVKVVGLDDAARNLGVERRRIYDIVNILESIGVLARKAKNQYFWIGFPGIPKALENIKDKSLKEDSGINVEPRSSQETRSSQEDYEEDEEDKRLLDDTEGNKEERCGALSSSRPRAENRREKSLGMLTEKFVKLFLTTDEDTITLDEAATLLFSDNHDSSQTKTKVRRLYDIANVLSSLNLIEKTHHIETRKPAFKWLGLNGKQSEVTIAVPSKINQNNKRSFGMDVTNMDLSKRRKLMAVDDKKYMETQSNKEDAKAHNATTVQKKLETEDYCFGPFTPVVASKKEDTCEEQSEKAAHIDDAWQDLATNFRPDYHNQALHDLFGHYLEAWKKWYSQMTQVSNNR